MIHLIFSTLFIILDQVYVPAVAMPFKLCIKLVLATTLLTAAKTTTKISLLHIHAMYVATYITKLNALV